MFAYQHSKIQPDIITMAKGITSGYIPLGAVVINENISNIYNTTTKSELNIETNNESFDNQNLRMRAIDLSLQTDNDYKLIIDFRLTDADIYSNPVIWVAKPQLYEINLPHLPSFISSASLVPGYGHVIVN